MENLIGKKVITKSKCFGNSTNAFAVSFENLEMIPAGSVGVVVDFSQDVRLPISFVTVRFKNNIYINVSVNMVDIIE